MHRLFERDLDFGVQIGRARGTLGEIETGKAARATAPRAAESAEKTLEEIAEVAGAGPR